MTTQNTTQQTPENYRPEVAEVIFNTALAMLIQDVAWYIAVGLMEPLTYKATYRPIKTSSMDEKGRISVLFNTSALLTNPDNLHDFCEHGNYTTTPEAIYRILQMITPENANEWMEKITAYRATAMHQYKLITI